MIATGFTCDGRGRRGGLQNKQAEAVLGIAKITLHIQRMNIMRKMEAGSLAELVRISNRLRSCRANYVKGSALQASAKYDPHVKSEQLRNRLHQFVSTSNFNFNKEI